MASLQLPSATFFPSPVNKDLARLESLVAPELRPALGRAETLLKADRPNDAATLLIDGLIGRGLRARRNEWSKMKWVDTEAYISETIRVVFSCSSDAVLCDKLLECLSTVRHNLRTNAQLPTFWEGVMSCVRRHLESLADDAAQCKADFLATDDGALKLIADVCGVEAGALAASKFEVDGFIRNFLNVLLFKTQSYKPEMQKIHFEFLKGFVPVLERHGLVQSLNALCARTRQYLQVLLYAPITMYVGTELDAGKIRRNRTADETRCGREFFELDFAAMDRAVQLLISLMTANVKLGQWSNVWSSLLECLKLLDRFTTDSDHAKIRAPAFRAFASVFFEARNPTFAAHCLTLASTIQVVHYDPKERTDTNALLTLAIAAALCAPDFTEGRALFVVGGSESSFKHSMAIARGFSLSFAPSRTSILRALTTDVGSAIEKASAPVLALLAVVQKEESAPADIFDTVNAAARAVVEAVQATKFVIADTEQSLILPLRRVALSKVVQSRLKVDDTMPLAELHVEQPATSFDDMYLSVYEPTLLNDIAQPLLVDQESGTVKFTQSSFERMNEAFRTAATAAAPVKRVTSRTPLVINVSEFQLELVRASAARDLATARKNKELQREKDQEQQRLDDIKAAENARIAAERRRQEEQNRLNDLKLEKEYKVAEMKERHRVFASRLQEKFKGLKIPAGIEDLHHDSFMDNLTKILANFTREQENAKVADIRACDYFERAVRERDIPKRKEVAESMAAVLEQEREERWSNYLAQHRAEYDAKVQLRERLSKQLDAAKRFEDGIKQRSSKPSKRDEQEELLRAEKARLMAASGSSPAPAAPAAAAPAAAAPAAPAAPAATTTPTAAPTTSSAPKWQPRSRT